MTIISLISNIAENLDSGNGTNDVCGICSTTAIPDDECLVVTKLEEVVGKCFERRSRL
jgi:hypothetical protein